MRFCAGLGWVVRVLLFFVFWLQRLDAVCALAGVGFLWLGFY